jgi:uncharacterized peroxidase-related enzyme
MSLIFTPAHAAEAPQQAHQSLAAVEQMLGSIPNMFRLEAASPAALAAHVAYLGALSKGSLDGKTATRIAVAIANVNGCEYCNSAHTFLAQRQKLDDGELAANRAGTSNDPRAAAIVQLAVQIAQQRGHVSSADVAAAKAAGLSESDLVEIVSHVAINTFTNYLNTAFQTEIDFPVVSLAKVA